jgi:hypothetical protein
LAAVVVAVELALETVDRKETAAVVVAVEHMYPKFLPHQTLQAEMLL